MKARSLGLCLALTACGSPSDYAADAQRFSKNRSAFEKLAALVRTCPPDANGTVYISTDSSNRFTTPCGRKKAAIANELKKLGIKWVLGQKEFNIGSVRWVRFITGSEGLALGGRVSSINYDSVEARPSHGVILDEHWTYCYIDDRKGAADCADKPYKSWF